MRGLIEAKPGKATSIGPIPGGNLAVDPAHFAKDLAADLPKEKANSMAISQVPIAASIGEIKITSPS